jgi:hypothetical protein
VEQLHQPEQPPGESLDITCSLSFRNHELKQRIPGASQSSEQLSVGKATTLLYHGDGLAKVDAQFVPSA